MEDYQIVYIVEFNDLAGRTCRAELWDYRDATTAIMPGYLNGSGKPVTLKNINNSNTVYSPIRGTELTVEIVSSTFGLPTFYSSNDFKWRCDYYCNDVLWFKGYLSLEDSHEEYVDYNHIVKLRFTDNLGILKDIELKQSNGSEYYEVDTFLNIISNCLSHTRLGLPINVSCSVFPSDTVDVTADTGLAITKVNTRTWLRSKGEFEDCYKVINDILLSWGCCLYQYRGEWWIDKWGDKMDVTGALNTWDYTDLNDPIYNVAFVDQAEIGSDVREVENPITISVSPPARYVRAYYRYSLLNNFIRNLNLDEGTFNPVLSQEVEDDDPTRSNWYAYDPTYLTVEQVAGNPEAYILSGDGRLIGEQYLVIKNITGTSSLDGKVSFEPFYCRVGDKVNLSLQGSHSGIAESFPYNFNIEIKVGDNYVIRKSGTEDEYILTATPSDIIFQVTDEPYNISDPQPKQWHSMSVDFFIPLKSGTSGAISNTDSLYPVTISLRYGGVAEVDYETWYKDINVDVDYGPSKADYNEYPISDDIRREFNFDSVLGEPQRAILNGVIFENDGITPTATWQRGDNDEELMFKQILVSEYYKFMNRPRLIIDGVFRGTMYETSDINTPFKPIGHFPVYLVSAFPNKRFTILSINDMDMHSLVWRATLVELYDITVDDYLNILPDTHTYKILYK